jgi:hypothetical protein
MKKYSFISALAIALVFVSTAFAADYSGLIAKDPVALVKLNLGSFLGGPVMTAVYKGEIKRSLDTVFNEFEKKTGFSFTRDITDIGFFADPGIDFNAPGPNGICFFISGKFDREKLMNEIEKGKMPPGISFQKSGDLKTVKFEKMKMSGAFIDENFFVLATGDVMEKIASKKFEAAALSGALKDKFETSCMFMHVKFNEALKKMVMTEETMAKLPPDLRESAAALSEVTASGKSLDFSLAFRFSGAKQAGDFKKSLEALKSTAELGLAAKLREAEEKIKNSATVFEMISSDAANMKTGLALLTEVMSLIKLEENGDSVIINLNFPAGYAEAFSPEAMPFMVAAVGIIAAVAIPNFKKARENARQKAREKTGGNNFEYND